MKNDNRLDPINRYLDLLSHSILQLHLCSIEYDTRTGEHYDNTQQNVETTHEQLKEQLSECQQALARSVSEEDSRLICTLLAIYSDEDILTSGLFPRQVFWPKLQATFIGSKDGGIVFYDFLDEALELSVFDNRVYEVFDHLLEQGFKGKYLNDLPKIKRYQQMLGSLMEKELPMKRRA